MEEYGPLPSGPNDYRSYTIPVSSQDYNLPGHKLLYFAAFTPSITKIMYFNYLFFLQPLSNYFQQQQKNRNQQQLHSVTAHFRSCYWKLSDRPHVVLPLLELEKVFFIFLWSLSLGIFIKLIFFFNFKYVCFQFLQFISIEEVFQNSCRALELPPWGITASSI